MKSYRIYVGNLPQDVTAEELKSKFTSFCTRIGSGDGHGGVEVRSKNENVFAYMDLYVDEENQPDRNSQGSQQQSIPIGIRKCIDVMNNTKWKGSLIKVQLAKENFMSKLKKEQQQNKEGSSDQTNRRHSYNDGHQSSHAGSNETYPRSPGDGLTWKQHHQKFIRKPDNFDFEIVSASSPSAVTSTKNKQSSPMAKTRENKLINSSTPVVDYKGNTSPVKKFKRDSIIPSSPSAAAEVKEKESSPKGKKQEKELLNSLTPVKKAKRDSIIPSSPSAATEVKEKESSPKGKKQEKELLNSSTPAKKAKRDSIIPSSPSAATVVKDKESLKAQRQEHKFLNSTPVIDYELDTSPVKKSKRDSTIATDEEKSGSPVKSKKILNKPAEMSSTFEISDNAVASPVKKSKQEYSNTVSSPVAENKTKASLSINNENNSSESDSDSEPEIKEGYIPKFRGILLSYPEGKTSENVEHEHDKLKSVSTITPNLPQNNTLILPAAATTSQKQQNQDSSAQEKASEKSIISTGIKFNPLKRLKSDNLRMKSMDNRFMNEKKKSDVIQNSLKIQHSKSSNEIVSVVGNEKQPKKKVMQLFNENDEDMEDTSFDIKQQFEGGSGQHLLELKSKWNFDDRFRVDGRFVDVKDNSMKLDGSENDEGLVKEKSGELQILNELFGREIVNPNKSNAAKGHKNIADGSDQNNQNQKSDSDFVIIPRYDPDLEEHQEKFVKKRKLIDVELMPKAKVIESESVTKSVDSLKKVEEKKLDSQAIPEPPKKVEYKVASNLKSLFAADSSTEAKLEKDQGQFSLLATFGDNYADEEQETVTSTTVITNGHREDRKIGKEEQTRNFWQSNPFKYDSSDEEDGDDSKKKHKSTNSDIPPPTKVVFKKDDFFFRSNDPRFAGLSDLFLKSEEDIEQIHKHFNEVERAELRALVRAKIKNTKRKGEKRDLAMKRIRRKQKIKRKQYTKKMKKF